MENLKTKYGLKIVGVKKCFMPKLEDCGPVLDLAHCYLIIKTRYRAVLLNQD
jgi:hypothetical protein